MKKQSIESLRYVFTISVALFDFMEVALGAANNRPSVKQQQMKILHNYVLQELNKKKPSMNQIKNLFKEMEELTKEKEL